MDSDFAKTETDSPAISTQRDIEHTFALEIKYTTKEIVVQGITKPVDELVNDFNDILQSEYQKVLSRDLSV